MTDGNKTAANPSAAEKPADEAARNASAENASIEGTAAKNAGANASITEARYATAPEDSAGPEYLETLYATVGEYSPAPPLDKPKEKPYDPDQARDNTRRGIAYWLLALLTLVVLSSFVIVILFSDGKVTFDNLKSLLELVMGPIVALVSAATGFYFGSQQSNNSKKT